MRHRKVNDKHPRHAEQHDRLEFHALGDRPDDQGRRDDGEHELVDGKKIVRHPLRVIGVGGDAHVAQEGVTQIADHAIARREREAVTARPPKNRHSAGEAETLSQDGEHVLAADQATIEKRQAGQRHEQHEGRAGHHPGAMPGAGARHLGKRLAIGGPRRVIQIGFDIRQALLDGSWR